MHTIAVIFIGFFVGLIARFLMPGEDPKGFLFTALLGAAGAFLGTFIGQVLGLYAPGESAGFIMSVVGAMIFLFLHKQISARQARL